jgi:hypothetical protein
MEMDTRFAVKFVLLILQPSQLPKSALTLTEENCDNTAQADDRLSMARKCEEIKRSQG